MPYIQLCPNHQMPYTACQYHEMGLDPRLAMNRPPWAVNPPTTPHGFGGQTPCTSDSTWPGFPGTHPCPLNYPGMPGRYCYVCGPMQMMQGAGRGPPGAGYGCYDNVVPSKAHGDAPGGDNNNMETD